MSIYSVLRTARRVVVDGPLIRPSRLKWERQQFLAPHNLGAHYGVYRSFAEARSQLPSNPGFNLESLAHEYVRVRARRVFEYDYPVMRWLEKTFQIGATRVLDIGGSVGVHYYGYKRYLQMPTELSWEVVEVPEIASVGRDLAAENRASPLHFITELDDAIGARKYDVWISAGAIQYVEGAHPARLLALCKARPAHVLLNKVPLHCGSAFVTTQNLGEGSFSPVHVYDRARFIRSISDLGYTLRDSWDVHERSIDLPGHPEHSVSKFTGLYFVDNNVDTSGPIGSTAMSGRSGVAGLVTRSPD